MILGESQALSASAPLQHRSPGKLKDLCEASSPGLSFSLHSQDSAIADASQLPELSLSPGQFSYSDSLIEDKENFENAPKAAGGHHRQPSVIIKSGVEQSYAHILNVLRKRDSSRGKAGENCKESSISILSDLSRVSKHLEKTTKSIDESPEVPIIEVDLDTGEKAYCTPIATAQKHASYTSPYGGTTNHTESNHFEIDLFENGAQSAGNHVSQGSLGALPARTYCPRCLVDVSTSVSLHLPRMPL